MALNLHDISRHAIASGPPVATKDRGRAIAVGTAVAGSPPHRSVREELPHTALTLSLARNR